MATPTLQSDTRPQATEGAVRSKQAYEAFIGEMHTRLKDNQNLARMAQDPNARPQMLRVVRNKLIGSVPKFQQLSEADQAQFTERALDQALEPTTGERVQRTIGDIAPVVAPAVAAAAGGGIPAVMAAGAAGAMLPELTKPATTGESPDFLEGVKQAALNGGLVGVAEKVIRPISGLFGRLRQNMVLGPGATSPQAIEAQRVLQPGLQARGTAMTPKQISRDQLPPVTEFIENVAESGLGGQGLMRAQRQKTDEVIAEAAVNLERALTQGIKTDEQAAGLFLQQANARELFMRKVSSQKHQIVDDLSKAGVKVDTKALVDMVQNPKDVTVKTLMRHFKLPEVRDQAGKLVRPSVEGHDGFLLFLNGMSQMGTRRMDFANADRARSLLLEIGRDFGGPTASGADKQVARLANTMAERLRTNMDLAAKKLDPKAAAAYADAKEFHKREVIDQFDDSLHKSIVKALEKEPGKFSQYVLSPENISKLKTIKEMSNSGQLDAWPQLQGRLLQHMVMKATQKESLGMGLGLEDAAGQGLIKQISGKALANEVKSLGEEGSKLLLEGPKGAAFKRFTNALEAAAQRPEGVGKIGTVLMQFGALSTIGGAAGGLAGGVISGGDWAAVQSGAATGAVVTLLTPRAFAKILTNEKAMTNIANGMIGGPKSAAFGRMLTTISLVNEEIQREVGGNLQQLVSGASRSPQALLPRGATPALSQAPPQAPPQ